MVSKDLNNEVYRQLGTAARIPAHLPTWKWDPAEALTPYDLEMLFYYFPQSTLPSKQVITQWERIASALNAGASGASKVVRYNHVIRALLTLLHKTQVPHGPDTSYVVNRRWRPQHQVSIKLVWIRSSKKFYLDAILPSGALLDVLKQGFLQ